MSSLSKGRSSSTRTHGYIKVDSHKKVDIDSSICQLELLSMDHVTHESELRRQRTGKGEVQKSSYVLIFGLECSDLYRIQNLGEYERLLTTRHASPYERP